MSANPFAVNDCLKPSIQKLWTNTLDWNHNDGLLLSAAVLPPGLCSASETRVHFDSFQVADEADQ